MTSWYFLAMSKDFWEKIKKPIIALAPMDGYTDSAFRYICKEVNPNIILFTEFTSADGIHYNAKRLLEKLKFDKKEKPIIAQIFGKNIDTYVTAAKYCQEQSFDGIDINMGCPSKKVVKSEHGVALRKKPQLAFKIIKAVAEATSLPVSVKTRLGWDSADDLIKFGQGVQKSGASLITVHGRTYNQGYGVKADYRAIYELKKHLKIPVLGNGDITSISRGKKVVKNLDGFMIGRAAIGNPWVFSDEPAPSFKNKIPLIKKHAQLLFKTKGKKVGQLEIRKHLVAYVKSIPNASKFRSSLVHVSSLKEISAILNTIKNKI